MGSESGPSTSIIHELFRNDQLLTRLTSTVMVTRTKYRKRLLSLVHYRMCVLFGLKDP